MREENIQKIEVHVAGICFNNDKILILQRDNSDKMFPYLWECGGGQVLPGENLEEAIIRIFKEKAGTEIKPIKILGTYSIDIPEEEQKKIPGVKFLCEFIGYNGKKSPELSKGFIDYKWLKINELDAIKFIPNVKNDIKEAFNLLTN
jgi:8-oxo-dGTP pyrophosphatase MutT (NUDIX family)